MVDGVFDTNSNGIIPLGLPGGFFIYEADGDERIIFAEPNIIELFGCDSFEDFIEVTGGTFKGIVHPEDVRKIENQIQAQTLFVEKRHDYVRYRIITKQGEERYVEDFGHVLHNSEGKRYFYVFIVDVDKNEYLNRNRNSYAEAEILANNMETDGLTGLLNMSFFYQRVQLYMANPDSWREEIAFIHFDIPNFKLFNEKNGFILGDDLLCDLAKAISDIFQGDIVARFSDDHFVVCATGTKEKIIEKVDEVYKRILQSEDVTKRVRIKAGIFYLDDRRAEIGLACDHARLACNSIKNRHDVNYCVYDDVLRESMRKQQYVIDHIDEAIEKEYIKVFYQPVIRIRTGEICGYEALVRWIDPSIGMFSPADFIDTLEQYHLIHLVDIYVVKKVCEDYVRLRNAGKELVPISINISRLDFELIDVYEVIYNTAEEYGVPHNMIDVEITESALNDNTTEIKTVCRKLRQKGHHVWIDDFGSGYSSLNTIAEHNFDVLKLDMVFLRSMDQNQKTGKIMTYIVQGAKAMGVQPLCEGVETELHYKFLDVIGCERAQGYYFGKPMPMEESRAYTSEKGMKWEKI